MKLLKINNISKTYHTKDCEINAIKNISFTINEGDFIAIVGPSGSGKTTILSIISNLENVSEGNIIKYKDNLKFGYMFQNDTLFPWLTVLDNCLIGLKINKCLNETSRMKCLNLLKTYDLDGFINNYPSSLSGGMRQRVALIRTLVLEPDILLLDEPFSALDYQTRLLVSNDVYEIIKKEKKTTVMVTHDISEAISMADKVIVLSHRPSVIKSVYHIKFENRNNPIENRKNKEFVGYFDNIWRDLDIHE